MTVNRIIEDKELGPLFVRVNARARRLTFRTKEDGIYVTVPPRTSLAEIENAIEQLRPRLKAAIQKQVRKLIDLDYRIDTEFFKLTLVSGQRERFLSRSELGEMQIIKLFSTISVACTHNLCNFLFAIQVINVNLF